MAPAYTRTIVPGKIIPGVLCPGAMDLKRTLAGNVRRLRLARGLSQEALAERANLSSRYVGAIERADVAASVTVLGQLADALQVDPSELIRATDRRRGK